MSANINCASKDEALNTAKAVEGEQKDLSAALDTITRGAGSNEARSQGPFAIRKGENPLTSRGYSFLKAMGLIAGHIDRENASVEWDVACKLKAYYDGFGFKKALPNSVWLPICGDFLVGNEALQAEVAQVTKAGVRVIEPDEIAAVRRRMSMGGYTKALSWLDETAGGAAVGPPAFGEFIEVLRNNAVLIQAGARVMPMPPQGRIIYPRQTTAMTAYHVGESTNITSSDLGTGDVTLQAKKLTILAKLPNELFHFSSIPIESLVREDMGMVVSLKMDKTLLEDAGSQTTPKGLINYANINSYTSVGSAADANSGYAIAPEDPYNMIGTTEEQNAKFKAFVMRPLLYTTLVNRRADAVSAGDKKGQFLFDIIRSWDAAIGQDRLSVGNLCGYPVYKSTQLSKTRTRGSGTTNNTYIIGGDFTDYLLAMSGAMEFALSTQGDTPFVADQTWLRGTMYYDGAPRHEASFTLMDNLLQNT